MSVVSAQNLYYICLISSESIKMAFEDKCFTFTWKLENISFCAEKEYESILSPSFVMESMDGPKWYLALYPRAENYVAFYLFRHLDSKHLPNVPISCELYFIAENSSVETLSTKFDADFLRHDNYGFDEFVKREELFVTKRSIFLPHDTLTARCRIWKTYGEMSENVRCFARTRIGVEKRSFVWNVKNFSTLQCGNKYSYQIQSLDREERLMSVHLWLVEGLDAEEIVCFKLNLHDRAIKVSTLLLFLIDISGEKIECNREEFWHDDISETIEFKFFFTKNNLMAMKSSYLPEDILSLHWEWAFSVGIVSNEIKNVQYGSISTENEFCNSKNWIYHNMAPLSYPLNDNVKSLYDENFLCDVKLKTSTRVFNAHKVVLSASSSVFKAMFSNDMKEKDSNCVDIEDLSDDTIRRMLDYIYTAHSTQDLTWESSSLLYAAADKYAIFSLKNICSSYMMDHISPANACEVLLLSEFYADDDLKSCVQDYILKHVRDTVNSDGWKLLLESNARLAAETLSLPYK